MRVDVIPLQEHFANLTEIIDCINLLLGDTTCLHARAESVQGARLDQTMGKHTWLFQKDGGLAAGV